MLCIRLSRLLALVPAQNAIVGIDLADGKQMVVVTDHDSKVLARRTFRCRAWDLGITLDWVAQRALGHLGARREQLIVDMTSQIHQIRALLECVWPAALDTARQPFRSRTWVAAISVIRDRDHGELARTRHLGLAGFERVVRRGGSGRNR